MALINEVRVIIYNKFILDWNNETLFTFDNEIFDTPENVPWVRTVVRNTVSNQDSLGKVGNRKFLRKGSVITQIFVPITLGLKEVDRLIEIARSIFEGKRLTDGIWFFETDTRELGASGDYYQAMVESKFNYEQIK